MIIFTCKKCGQKIKVSDVHSGDRGKCPICKELLTVPEISTNSHSEEQENPNIEDDIDFVPDSKELQLKRESLSSTEIKNNIFMDIDKHDLSEKRRATEEEKPPVRKSPWLLDIFLYPTSTAGLINMGIFWVLIIVIRLLGIILLRLGLRGAIFLGIISVPLVGYILEYYMDCIRDSAKGGIRAPENIGMMPQSGEAVRQFFDVFAMAVLFWGPVAFYLIYRIFWASGGSNDEYRPGTDLYFWLLSGYGIFFFPMGLLALAMFDSSSAFSPFLWAGSIISTFFNYLVLVMSFCGLVLFFSMITTSPTIHWILTYLFFVYLAMIAAHLLGRFFYKNSKKLNWEV